MEIIILNIIIGRANHAARQKPAPIDLEVMYSCVCVNGICECRCQIVLSSTMKIYFRFSYKHENVLQKYIWLLNVHDINNYEICH